jgi:hypothetical protein
VVGDEFKDGFSFSGECGSLDEERQLTHLTIYTVSVVNNGQEYWLEKGFWKFPKVFSQFIF